MSPAIESALADAFRSLDELRAQHDQLAASVGEADSVAGHEHLVDEFVRRAVATGAVLDAAEDRKAAQALVSFWSSMLDRHGTGTGSQAQVPRAKPNELLLKPFDS